MAEEHTGVKDLWGTIKKSPALMITGVVGIGLVLLLVAKKGGGSSGSGQTQSTNSTLPQQTGQGSYIQPYIEPIVIPMYGNGNGNPAGVATGPAPSPSTGITMPAPSGSGSNPVTSGNASGSPGSGPATTPSNLEPYLGPVTGGGSGAPYFGLLGPRVQLLSGNKYQIPGVQGPTPLPLGLQSKDLTSGAQGRVWYNDPGTGQARLLTAGSGPAVTNSPQNGTVTQQSNNSSQGTVKQVNQQQSSNNSANTNLNNSFSSTNTNRGSATIPSNG